MLRINLLPSYVAQRRLTRQIAVASIALCAGIILVMLGMYEPLPGQIKSLSDQAAAAEAIKKTVEDLNTKTAAVQAQMPQYTDKTKFVTGVEAYNAYFPKLYRRVASYTVPGILYSSISCTGTSLSIDAYTPRLAVMSDYLAHMWNNPDLSAVSVSAFPGYKADYTPSKKTETLPQLPPGYEATFKGSTQAVKSFIVEGGNITEISSGETTGLNNQQNTGMNQQNQKVEFNAAVDGFDFTVTATLKSTAVATPPTPPSMGGGGSSSTGPSGPGGAPGGPGGMPPGAPGGPGPGGRPAGPAGGPGAH